MNKMDQVQKEWDKLKDIFSHWLKNEAQQNQLQSQKMKYGLFGRVSW